MLTFLPRLLVHYKNRIFQKLWTLGFVRALGKDTIRAMFGQFLRTDLWSLMVERLRSLRVWSADLTALIVNPNSPPPVPLSQRKAAAKDPAFAGEFQGSCKLRFRHFASSNVSNAGSHPRNEFQPARQQGQQGWTQI